MTKATLAICAATAATIGLTACGNSTKDSKDSKQVAVTLTDSGCTPQHIDVASGPVTFNVTNGGTSKVSEMELKNTSGVILGESENVVEGIKGTFSLNLDNPICPALSTNTPTGESRCRTAWNSYAPTHE